MRDYIRVILIICGILLMIVYRNYWVKVEREYNSIHKGTIKIYPIFEILGFSGIVFSPYVIVCLFISNGFNLDIIIVNSVFFILFIFTLLIFCYSKLYIIKYSGDYFTIRKLFAKTQRYNFSDVLIVTKKTKYIVYKDNKKICTIFYQLDKNSYDFLRKLLKKK